MFRNINNNFHIERDPNNKKLENEVNQKLHDIFKTIEPEKPLQQKIGSVNFVSVEDAAKELLAMGIKL